MIETITLVVFFIPLVVMPAWLALGVAQLVYRLIKGVW